MAVVILGGMGFGVRLYRVGCAGPSVLNHGWHTRFGTWVALTFQSDEGPIGVGDLSWVYQSLGGRTGGSLPTFLLMVMGLGATIFAGYSWKRQCMA